MVASDSLAHLNARTAETKERVIAFDDKASNLNLIRVRRQKNMTRTLAAVRDVMNVANTAFEATCEQYRRLARTDIVADDLRRYVQLVF